MNNKIDKETEEHKIFYENFLKYTTYSTVIFYCNCSINGNISGLKISRLIQFQQKRMQFQILHFQNCQNHEPNLLLYSPQTYFL